MSATVEEINEARKILQEKPVPTEDRKVGFGEITDEERQQLLDEIADDIQTMIKE